MIALDPLLQVLSDVMQRIFWQEPLFPGCGNGRRIGSGPIGADPVRREQGSVLQHLAEEAFGRLQIALRRQEKVDRDAVLVDGPVEVAPLAADLDVGLVNANRPTVRLAEGSQPALDQRRVSQDPAVHGGVIHRQAALEKELLNVAVAQGIAQVPRDRLQDQRCLEVAAFEVVLGSVPQLLGNRTQDHGSPPQRQSDKVGRRPSEPSTPEVCDRPMNYARRTGSTPSSSNTSKKSAKRTRSRPPTA